MINPNLLEKAKGNDMTDKHIEETDRLTEVLYNFLEMATTEHHINKLIADFLGFILNLPDRKIKTIFEDIQKRKDKINA